MADHDGSAYVVIPSYIFFDKNLSDEERWLYGYISSHANLKGYCFATNKRMSEDWNCSVRKVAGVLSSLVDKGYIYTCTDRKNGKAKRRIFLVDIMALRQFCRDHSAKNCTMDDAKNCTTHSAENCTQNNINNNIPPIAPQGGPQTKCAKRSRTGEVALSPELEASFDLFWSKYPWKVDKQRSRRRWRDLNPDAETLEVILAAVESQKQTQQWRDGAIPMPSTWLYRRRWEDEVKIDTPAQPEQDGRRWL